MPSLCSRRSCWITCMPLLGGMKTHLCVTYVRLTDYLDQEEHLTDLIDYRNSPLAAPGHCLRWIPKIPSAQPGNPETREKDVPPAVRLGIVFQILRCGSGSHCQAWNPKNTRVALGEEVRFSDSAYTNTEQNSTLLFRASLLWPASCFLADFVKTSYRPHRATCKPWVLNSSD